MIIFFSASMRGFYDEAYKNLYVAGSGWPDDAVLITEDEWLIYTASPPDGKVLGSDADGKPAWVSVYSTTLDEYKAAYAARAAAYKYETNALSEAYAMAALTDGPNQVTKQESVHARYIAAQAQYVSDIAAIKTQYGVV